MSCSRLGAALKRASLVVRSTARFMACTVPTSAPALNGYGIARATASSEFLIRRASLIAATDKLHEAFDRHCRDTFEDLCDAFGDSKGSGSRDIDCDRAAISAVLNFFNTYDQKWRETCEVVVRQKGLTPAYANDA